MVISNTETGMGDCGVGTIVWVRRRNGSWWPGKILGPDELSASHLMSPRSGTPVKLLGREDASVDWYNLEKSKRVKLFRCGEFDDCIERAEASQGMPPKKREKYARREDAIFHALELEKQLLEKKYGKLGISSNGMKTKLLDGVGKDKLTPPEFLFDDSKYADSKMNESLEDKRKGLSVQRVDGGSKVGVDEKSSYARPRRRGLQDLDHSPVSLKYNPSSLPALNGSHEHPPDDGNHDGLTPENTIIISGKNLLEKRKWSQGRHLEESLGKRRDKHCPLVQVLENSAKSPVVNSLQLQDDGGSAPPLVLGKKIEVLDPAKGGDDVGTAVKSDESLDYNETLPDRVEISTPKSEGRDNMFSFGLSEENATGTTEDTESDSSGTESMFSDTYDAMTTLSDEAEHIELIPKSFGRSEAQGEHDCMSVDSELPDDGGESPPTSVAVSKWQLKGKRNNRTLMRRYPNAGEKKVSVGSRPWISSTGEDNYAVDGTDSFDKNLTSQAVGYMPRGLDSSHDIIDWENWTRNDQSALKRYWEQSAEYHDPVYVGDMMKPLLIDVDVQVQSGYQREHVPMISLMSRLNDKAIVGHPIPIETLEDGSSEMILSVADDLQAESLGYDATLQPWRTSRRTAKCRVPRPLHVSTLNKEDQHEYADEERKSSRKGGISRKCPSAKLLKKPQWRSGLSSSQKIRMLSSIGGREQQGQSSDLKAEGVMKPESLVTAAVACIPVKLVFSRLHEELVAHHQ